VTFFGIYGEGEHEVARYKVLILGGLLIAERVGMHPATYFEV
jgi:hypothetical protein